MPKRNLDPAVAKTVTRNVANQGQYLFISLAEGVPLTIMGGHLGIGDLETLIVETHEACGLTVSDRARRDIRKRLTDVNQYV